MVRAALAQFTGNRDREANLLRAEAMARQAAESGAQIICFPELCSTMYFCYEYDRSYFEWAEPESGPSFHRIARLAEETRTVIVFPLYENDNGMLYNAALVIGPSGDLIGKYRKNSIPKMSRNVRPGDAPSDEQFYFRPGNLGFPVFDTPMGVKIGILICYDRHFPEAARIIGLEGADLLLVPTATAREWMREVWEIELRAHAIANSYYVGGVNKVGCDIGGSSLRPHFGNSVFFDPQGSLLARASRDADEIIYTDIDGAVVEDTRDGWGFYRTRRPDAYGPIVGDAKSTARDGGGLVGGTKLT